MYLFGRKHDLNIFFHLEFCIGTVVIAVLNLTFSNFEVRGTYLEKKGP